MGDYVCEQRQIHVEDLFVVNIGRVLPDKPYLKLAINHKHIIKCRIHLKLHLPINPPTPDQLPKPLNLALPHFSTKNRTMTPDIDIVKSLL